MVVSDGEGSWLSTAGARAEIYASRHGPARGPGNPAQVFAANLTGETWASDLLAERRRKSESAFRA